jgi:hypothetical protein
MSKIRASTNIREPHRYILLQPKHTEFLGLVRSSTWKAYLLLAYAATSAVTRTRAGSEIEHELLSLGSAFEKRANHVLDAGNDDAWLRLNVWSY